MKNIYLIVLCFLFPASLLAQKAWVEPNPINAEDSITIFVDIKACDCQRLLGTTEDVFLWTWMPGDPVIGNGDWTKSNEDMKMTHIGDDVWSFKMLPTEFYGIDAATVYENDMKLLLKHSDGSGAGGGGCDEDKTEDLDIELNPPVLGPRKTYSFPDYIDTEDNIAARPDDVFSFFYNNTVETKDSLINNTKDLYIYVRGTLDNGTQVKIASLGQVDNTPELKMEDMGEGIYRYQIIPNVLYADKIPSGRSLKSMKFQIVQEGFTTTDQTVDGEFDFIFQCN